MSETMAEESGAAREALKRFSHRLLFPNAVTDDSTLKCARGLLRGIAIGSR
jgi:hypothetical protein